jgi:hypothetical protein
MCALDFNMVFFAVPDGLDGAAFSLRRSVRAAVLVNPHVGGSAPREITGSTGVHSMRR